MHKVIEETRSRKWIRKRGRQRPDDELPKSKGMGRMQNGQDLWIHIGPLKRWLRSKVGQPWNDSYAELCACADYRSWSKDRLRRSVLNLVQRRTYLIQGEVWCFVERWGEGKNIRVNDAGWRNPVFYVHPETGILQETPCRKQVLGFTVKQNHDAVRRWLPDRSLLMKIECKWFSLEMMPFADAPKVPPFDLLFKVRLYKSHAFDAYGKAMYCIRKRQLSRAELRRHGLVNSATPSGIHAMLGADTIERMKRSNGNPVRGRLERSIICFQAGLGLFRPCYLSQIRMRFNGTC